VRSLVGLIRLDEGLGCVSVLLRDQRCSLLFLFWNHDDPFAALAMRGIDLVHP
jgi:hypothetical protein